MSTGCEYSESKVASPLIRDFDDCDRETAVDETMSDYECGEGCVCGTWSCPKDIISTVSLWVGPLTDDWLCSGPSIFLAGVLNVGGSDSCAFHHSVSVLNHDSISVLCAAIDCGVTSGVEVCRSILW